MNANMFWSVMIQIFGGMWIEKHGERPNQMWQELIGDLDPKTIQMVVNHFKVSGHAFPPNLSEVGAIAKQFKGSVPGPGPVPERPRPLPSTEEADQRIKGVLDGLDSLQNGQKRRTTFLPGESFQSHQEAWRIAFKSGKTLAEFESERFLKNGWTAADEALFKRWKADIIKPRPRDPAGRHMPPSITF